MIQDLFIVWLYLCPCQACEAGPPSHRPLLAQGPLWTCFRAQRSASVTMRRVSSTQLRSEEVLTLIAPRLAVRSGMLTMRSSSTWFGIHKGVFFCEECIRGLASPHSGCVAMQPHLCSVNHGRVVINIVLHLDSDVEGGLACRGRTALAGILRQNR